MASDQGLQDPMASECDNRAVMWMWLIVIVGIGLKSVVEAARIVVHVDSVEFGRRHHLSKIPKFHGLVFSIGDDVSPIALAIDIC